MLTTGMNFMTSKKQVGGEGLDSSTMVLPHQTGRERKKLDGIYHGKA